MNLLSRLVLLIGLFFSVIGGGLWLSTYSARTAIDELATEWQADKSGYFENAVKLQGVALESLVKSYAWWPQMVRYVEAPTKEWAANNLDYIVGRLNGADALWVLNPDMVLIHSINESYGQPPLPFTEPGALKQLSGNNTFRFFTNIRGQLWEIYGALILDSAPDPTAHGYLLLGKHWDENWLARLEALAGARLSVQFGAPAGAPPLAAAGSVLPSYRHWLAGPDGRTLATVTGQFELRAATETANTIERQLLLAGVCLLAALCAVTAFLAIHVLRPMGKIARCLETRNPIVIADLLGEKTEFGEIARLLANQLRQGRMLQEEIRRHLATPSADDQRREAETNESLRLRLASNLHDGPMQAIYAAGLQVDSLLAGKNPVAVAQLASVNSILNQAAADLRNIVLDLEPEELRDQDLESALHRLEKHMHQIGRCAFTLEIAEGCLDGLSREAQLHLYYIARELVSNALRHARPAQASLRYRNLAGFLRLDWMNDGVSGLTPFREGTGLRNIGHRVQEFGGTWRHRREPSGIWTVMVELPYTSLTNPTPLIS